ncbi:unnamed protein product [Blepharisma stoltei]|uniref:Uncharacterized protein n=1 Tax=Blepharisma stoltei TaxID=1481888 RepID=A0AAU9JLL8_9CILI|nr:unnamed protein product [Blepharisma stoltei]
MDIPQLDLNFESPEPNSVRNTAKKNSRYNRRVESDHKVPDNGLRIPSSGNYTPGPFKINLKQGFHKGKSNPFPSDTKSPQLSDDFANSVGNFFKKSKEIQIQLDKLNDICKGTPKIRSPAATLHKNKTLDEGNILKKRSFIEQKFFQKINSLIVKLGYNQIIDGEFDRMLCIIIDILEEQCRGYGSKRIYNSQGVFSSFGSNIWSRSISPIIKAEEDENFPNSKVTLQMWADAKLVDEEKVFINLMKKDFDPKSADDVKVMSIIILYEEQLLIYQKEIQKLQEQSQIINFEDPESKNLKKAINSLTDENNRLKERIEQLLEANNKIIETSQNKTSDQEIVKGICEILEVDTNNLVNSVLAYKESAKKHIWLNSSLQELYEEISEHKPPTDTFQLLQQIRNGVQQLKLAITQLKIFRSQIIKALEINEDVNNGQIVQTCNTLPYFKQLFNLNTDVTNETESIFGLMHELHSLIQYLKSKLEIDPGIKIPDAFRTIREKLSN